jgi:hypothetical protein
MERKFPGAAKWELCYGANILAGYTRVDATEQARILNAYNIPYDEDNRVKFRAIKYARLRGKI